VALYTNFQVLDSKIHIVVSGLWHLSIWQMGTNTATLSSLKEEAVYFITLVPHLPD